MDNDAIERALAAHPTPWTTRKTVWGIAALVDSAGDNALHCDMMSDNDALLILAAVNVYPHVAALVEAAREHLDADGAFLKVHQREFTRDEITARAFRRDASRETLRAALAPFENQE